MHEIFLLLIIKLSKKLAAHGRMYVHMCMCGMHVQQAGLAVGVNKRGSFVIPEDRLLSHYSVV